MVQHNDLSCEFFNRFCRCTLVANNVPSLYIFLAGSSYIETNVVAWPCFLILLMMHLYTLDFTFAFGWHKQNCIVDFHYACFYPSYWYGAYASYRVDILNRQSQWLVHRLFGLFEQIQCLHNSRSFVPTCIF